MAGKSPKAKINHSILTWARNSLGYKPSELAEKLKVKENVYQSWEEGKGAPSFSQLKKISDVLKRPSAVFFMKDIPKDFPIPKDFRVLDESEIQSLEPKTLLEIRKAQRKRQLAIDMVRELDEEIPEFQDSITLNDDVKKIAGRYRKIFLKDHLQKSIWSNEYQALNTWKTGVEELGVLVFQASLDSLEQMRGLAIYDRRFPIILLNTKDSPRGKIFSMLHEFCHLLLRKSGIGNIDPNWKTKGQVNSVEVFCNEFAGECLVPADLLRSVLQSNNVSKADLTGDQCLRLLVRTFQASWEVVLRRLLEEQYISGKLYNHRRSELLEFFARHSGKKASGPVPIETRALAYNGDKFTELVINGFDQEKITSADVVDYLGISYKHLDKVRASLMRKLRGA